jgi:hypothetical protein
MAYKTWQEARIAAVKLGYKTRAEYEAGVATGADKELSADPYTEYEDFPGWKAFLEPIVEAPKKDDKKSKEKEKTMKERLPLILTYLFGALILFLLIWNKIQGSSIGALETKVGKLFDSQVATQHIVDRYTTSFANMDTNFAMIKMRFQYYDTTLVKKSDLKNYCKSNSNSNSNSNQLANNQQTKKRTGCWVNRKTVKNVNNTTNTTNIKNIKRISGGEEEDDEEEDDEE